MPNWKKKHSQQKLEKIQQKKKTDLFFKKKIEFQKNIGLEALKFKAIYN